jgi:hypothetical protein
VGWSSQEAAYAQLRDIMEDLLVRDAMQTRFIMLDEDAALDEAIEAVLSAEELRHRAWPPTRRRVVRDRGALGPLAMFAAAGLVAAWLPGDRAKESSRDFDGKAFYRSHA